ncbi:MAG: oligosaccharide flippase family protein, partial [Alcanivoracaceae bacterium]|nr:oligosaccharide flippase family protein [Alcanivoracaceae bacterium]
KFKRKIKSNETAIKVINALIGSVGIRLLGMSLGFLVGVQLARGLGTDGYGLYSLVMSIIALFTVFTQFGIPQLTIREVSKAKVKKNWGAIKGILIWSNYVILIMFLIILLALFTLKWLNLKVVSDLEVFHTFLYGLMFVPLLAVVQIRSCALMGLQKIVLGQISDVVLRPLFFSCSLFVCFQILSFDASASNAMFLQLFSIALVFFIALILLKKNMPVDLSKIKPNISARKWLSSSVPMAFTEGMRVLQGHLAILILGFFLSLNDIGIFKVAVSISVLIAMPVSLINTVSGSIVSDLYTKKEFGQLAKISSAMSILMVLGVLALVIPFVIYGHEIIVWSFGSGYDQSVVILLIIGFGHLISAFFGINAILLNMTKHEKRVTRAILYSLVVNIVLAIVLILNFGLIGAAVANAVSLVIWNVLMWYDVKKLLKINSMAWIIGNDDVRAKN